MSTSGQEVNPSHTPQQLTLIKWPILSSLLLQLEVSADPLAAVVYFPLICCNLEGIDLTPRPTGTRSADMDRGEVSFMDAERLTTRSSSSPLLETRWL